MVIKNPRLYQLTLSKYLYIKFLFKEKLSGKKIYIQKWDGEKNQRYVSCKITPPPFFFKFISGNKELIWICMS